jgi:IMP dehydrogenase
MSILEQLEVSIDNACMDAGRSLRKHFKEILQDVAKMESQNRCYNWSSENDANMIDSLIGQLNDTKRLDNLNLDFDDITLVPRVISTIESRNDVKTDVVFNKDITLTSPVLASPMRDVCDGKVAAKMRELGGLGIIHRFLPIEDQVKEWNISNGAAAAIGVNGDSFERFQELHKAGCRVFCIDVASGGSILVKNAIEKLSGYDVQFIVGNVASKEVYEWLEQFEQVRGIRVGIANGAACSTKDATGISHGMASCIWECNLVKKRTLLIADGGIRSPADACKSLALGADIICLGQTIARTEESPAELIKQDGKFYKVYHGSASFETQSIYRNRKPRYIEGRTRLLEYEGESLEALMTRFADGLRSSMSYFNAHNLDEYRKNVSFAHK